MTPGGAAAQLEILDTAPAEQTIAIVPFSNLTGNPTDAWIGDGIAASLVTGFPAGTAVIVALPPGGSPGAGVALGRDVGVAVGAPFVLVGAYQRLGELVRITAQVVDVATGAVVRSSKVDGDLEDLFELQDRVVLDLSESRPVPGSDAAGLAPPADASAPASPTPSFSGSPTATPETPARAAGSVAAGFLAGAPALATLIDGPPPPVAPEVMSRDEQGRTTVRAIPLEEGIRLDGQLDEAVYHAVPAITDFIQQVPDIGAPATEKTEAWVMFDDTNVYVSARVWDSAPESQWVANEMRRDTNQLRQNDTFTAFFDTFYDRRNGFNFYTNPLGARADQQFTNEGNPNGDWNPVWDVRTGRFDGGWTVEMEIPFKTLRYRSGDAPQIWGLQLRRAIRRKNEWVYLTRLPLSAGGGRGSGGIFRVSAAGTLVGIEPPVASRNIEIKPYAIGGVTQDAVGGGERESDGDFGLDVKYGITQNLTADFTYNTDFAQVEVDEQQVNLTRFSLFFPEKREFFLEGRGVFGFARGGCGSGGGGGGGGGFFGGLNAPTLFYSRRIGLQGGQVVPIVGGGRVTGKVGQFDVGALSILTDDEMVSGAERTNFTVARVRRDILRRSSVGGIFTNRSVALTGDGASQTYGVDSTFAFFDNLQMIGYYARTESPGLVGKNNSYQGQFDYAADRYGLQIDHVVVEDNFNPEIGFLRRDNFRRTYAQGRFSPRPRSLETVRQFRLQGSIDYILNADQGFLETRQNQLQFNTEFESSDQFGITVNDNYERLLTPFSPGPDVTIPVGGYTFNDVEFRYQVGAQRRVNGSVSVLRGGYFNGDITTVGFTRGRIGILPQMSVEPSISLNWIDTPQGSFRTDLALARVNYAFNPRMFFSGLVQYNSASDTVSGNLRLRWEYSPGSELLVVYTEDRDTTPLRPQRYSALRNRGFVIKFNRLFRY
ncbi:MAG: DUF5916 domain-containing protein [Acidobacteriota bacterium]|nr:DUF5916 domain-containing protein [Acidobacteriota bacterium]